MSGWDARGRAAESARIATSDWHLVPGKIDRASVRVHFDAERLGLRESLEAYASRLARPPYAVRSAWRREGLRLLRITDWGSAPVAAGLCAIAPGIAVPTAFVDWPDDGPPLPWYAQTRAP